MAAADIGDLGAPLQFGDDAVERREPVADQIIVVAGAEKPRHRAEQAAGLIAPADTPPPVLNAGWTFG